MLLIGSLTFRKLGFKHSLELTGSTKTRLIMPMQILQQQPIVINQKIFPSCETIREIRKYLHFRKLTRCTVLVVKMTVRHLGNKECLFQE